MLETNIKLGSIVTLNSTELKMTVVAIRSDIIDCCYVTPPNWKIRRVNDIPKESVTLCR